MTIEGGGTIHDLLLGLVVASVWSLLVGALLFPVARRLGRRLAGPLGGRLGTCAECRFRRLWWLSEVVLFFFWIATFVRVVGLVQAWAVGGPAQRVGDILVLLGVGLMLGIGIEEATPVEWSRPRGPRPSAWQREETGTVDATTDVLDGLDEAATTLTAEGEPA